MKLWRSRHADTIILTFTSKGFAKQNGGVEMGGGGGNSTT